MLSAACLGRIVGGVVIALLYVFLLAPILIVVVTSFNASTLSTFPPRGLSVRWYHEFVRSAGFLSAFWFSLGLGTLAAVTATGVGFTTSYALRRYVGRRRDMGRALALLPVMIPEVLLAMSLLFLVNRVPLPDFGVLLVGHTIVCVPFTVAGISASLESVDPALEWAAMTLGASRRRIMFEIVMPLIAPGLLSALLFAFIVSFGDVYMALFLAVPGMTTLPVEIFSYLQWESTPVVAAITTVQVLLIVCLGLVVERLVGVRRLMRV